MRKRGKMLIAFAVAGVLLLSVGVGFVIAQETAPVASDSTAAETQETSLSNSVNEAGASIDQSDTAIPQECIDKLDELIAQGKITEQQREQCLERMRNGQCQGWGSCINSGSGNINCGDKTACLNSGSGNINGCRWDKTACQIEEQQTKVKPQPRGCCKSG